MTGIILSSGGNNGADVSAVTATANDVLLPKVIVDAQGNPITGVIPSYSGNNPLIPDNISHNIHGVYVPDLTISAVPTEVKSATPSAQQQIISPSQGKFLSQVTINATPTQAKTVTPTSSQQIITPDSGKFLSQVTVNAAPSQKQVYSGTVYVTPSASAQYAQLPSGYDGMSSVYVYGDSNLKASNIKSGVTIFGKTGTYEGEGGETGYTGSKTVNRSSTTQLLFAISSGKLLSFGFVASSGATTGEVVAGTGRRGSNTGRAAIGSGSVGNVLSLTWSTSSVLIEVSGYIFVSSYTFYYAYTE